jgi:inositol-polyphosphate multikinase
MQILTNLWAIQKWIRTQKVFQFYSSSILIVYDARKLRQVLESQKRQQNSLNGNCNNNSTIVGNPLSDSSGDAKLKANRSSNSLRESGGDSLHASSTTIAGASEKEPPKAVYKKIQRSHSSINDYEQVSGTKIQLILVSLTTIYPYSLIIFVH